MKIKLPKGEKIWVVYQTPSGNALYVLTSKIMRDYYYLYEILDDGKLNKLGKARYPDELEESFDISAQLLAKIVE